MAQLRQLPVTIAGFLEVPVSDHRWPETEQVTAEGSALRFPPPGKVARLVTSGTAFLQRRSSAAVRVADDAAGHGSASSDVLQVGDGGPLPARGCPKHTAEAEGGRLDAAERV